MTNPFDTKFAVKSGAPLQGAPLVLPITARTGSSSGIISGYGAHFGGINRNGFGFVRGAFERALRDEKPAMLWSHAQSEPIGQWTEAREDDRGLYVRGQINGDVQRGREALALLADGSVTGLSIGGFPIRFEDKPNGIVIQELELFEVSVVAIPADPEARVISLKSAEANISTVREFEHWLRASGLPRDVAQRLASSWHKLRSEEPTPDYHTLELEANRVLADIRRNIRTYRRK